MSGLLLVPTLNRIELLKNFIQSYKETESVVKTVVLVDNVDLKVNAAGYKEIEHLLPETVSIVDTGECVSMGDKIRFIYPDIKKLVPDIRWLGLLNDDHYIKTKNWDKITDELIDGKNVVSTNDGYWNAGLRVCGLTAFSVGLLEAVGLPIYPDRLQHLYIDDVWKAIGESSGCWHETMRINIEHRHVLKGAMKADTTFVKVSNEENYKKEEAIFQAFMESKFKDICLNIVKFRSDEVLDSKFV